MKAALRIKYGSPEFLVINEVEKPVPKENELLIKVHATTVNRTDCALLLGKPFIIRFFLGLLKPNLSITGTDFAGTVESVGKKVTLFQTGDKVWGFNDLGLQSHAEYMAISEQEAIAAIPAHITFEQAAASAEAAHYACNFINKIRIEAGQKVLVNGGTGAIGSAMIQMLKFHGLHVTATCRTEHIDNVKALGADKIIDYTKDDFTKDDESYDLVFDAVGKSTFGACKPLLKKRGIYISSELGPGIQNPFFALVTPLFGGKKVIFPMPLDIKASLGFVKDLIEKGKFTPLMDKSYPLEKISEAFHFVRSGQKVGNVIITFG